MKVIQLQEQILDNSLLLHPQYMKGGWRRSCILSKEREGRKGTLLEITP